MLNYLANNPIEHDVVYRPGRQDVIMIPKEILLGGGVSAHKTEDFQRSEEVFKKPKAVESSQDPELGILPDKKDNDSNNESGMKKFKNNSLEKMR